MNYIILDKYGVVDTSGHRDLQTFTDKEASKLVTKRRIAQFLFISVSLWSGLVYLLQDQEEILTV